MVSSTIGSAKSCISTSSSPPIEERAAGCIRPIAIIFPKAIGGFGNSEGGVIVWGIDCRNLPALGDIANAKFPIDNPSMFKSWLEGAVSGCTVQARRRAMAERPVPTQKLLLK